MVEPLDPILVRTQIVCAFEDLRPAAVKVGTLANDEIASEVARTLRDVGARNVVADPVLRPTSGTSLMEPGGGLEGLLRLCGLATPNAPEALRLCGGAHASDEDGPDRMRELAGMLMMGALGNTYVHLSLANEGAQATLDSIIPGLLPLVAIFVIYYIMKNVTQQMQWISLGIIAVGLILALIGLC